MIVKRKTYSDLDQKEFGIKDLGKNIKKLGEKLSIRKNLENKSNKLQTELEELGKQVKPNKKLGRNLAREAYRNNTRVFDNNKFFRVNRVDEISDKSIPISKDSNEFFDTQRKLNWDFLTEEQRKAYEALAHKEQIINLSRGFDERPDVLAHEIGHKLNEKGKKTKKVTRIHRDAKNKLIELEDKEAEGKLGFKDRISQIYNSGKERIYLPKEERNAWKNGLDLMKNNGASKEELGLAKKISKKAVDKYKVDSTLDLYNSIIKKKRKK